MVGAVREPPLLIRRERKSFFKRLFEKKNPELKVDWEDVMFFQKQESGFRIQESGELLISNP